jgi:hypothetical protein
MGVLTAECKSKAFKLALNTFCMIMRAAATYSLNTVVSRMSVINALNTSVSDSA